MEDFSLTIIGSGSALSMHDRHPSCQVLQYGSFHCLIDCGEGSQDRIRSAGIKLFNIRAIFISHLHGDHLFGLPGLLGTFTHLKRMDPLIIVGPPGIKGLLDAIIHYTEMPTFFPLNILEYQPSQLQSIMVDGHLEVLTFPLNHRVPCNGYLFRELHTASRMNKAMIERYKLTTDQILIIKSGADLNLGGQIVPAAHFYEAPPAPVSYAYCSDTRYDPHVLDAVRGVSVLYHETTFLNNLAEMAETTGHSTAAEAGQLAAAAKVGCLITGHYSSRYRDAEVLVNEAKAYFSPVLLAEEGRKYNLRRMENRHLAH